MSTSTQSALRICPHCGSSCAVEHQYCPACGFPVGTLSTTNEDKFVGKSLPEDCYKPGNVWVCPLVGTGDETVLTVKVDTRGKERELRFEVSPRNKDFDESPTAVLPNVDLWP